MLDLGGIRLDLQKLDEGCWWKIRMEGGVIEGDPVEKPEADDAAVLLVPANAGFEKQLEREREPFVSQLRREDLPDAERDRLIGEINGRAVAKKLLRGWQNLSFGGKEVPWSEAEAERLLTRRDWRNLLDFCVAAASHRQAALAKEEDEAAGN